METRGNGSRGCGGRGRIQPRLFACILCTSVDHLAGLSPAREFRHAVHHNSPPTMSTPTRQAIFPARPHALYKEHGYSPAILSGDLLFVSGMVGAREDGSPEPELPAQVQLAFDNLQGVLAGAGCTFDDVIDVTMFLIDPEVSMGLMIEAMRKAFPHEPYPNVTAVGVNWLAGFQFEVKVIARVTRK